MKYSLIVFLLASTSIASVMPRYFLSSNEGVRPEGRHHNINTPLRSADNFPFGRCVSLKEAKQWVQRFASVLQHQPSDLGNARTTASEIIADGFIEQSNSILSLRGLPLTDGIAAHSKEEWINGMLDAPPFGGIETLKVLAGAGDSCNQVLWYWSFEGIGSGQYLVKGFNRFTLVRHGFQLQASQLELEFDSIA